MEKNGLRGILTVAMESSWTLTDAIKARAVKLSLPPPTKTSSAFPPQRHTITIESEDMHNNYQVPYLLNDFRTDQVIWTWEGAEKASKVTVGGKKCEGDQLEDLGLKKFVGFWYPDRSVNWKFCVIE